MRDSSHRILGTALAQNKQRGLFAASIMPSVPAAEVKRHGHTEAHFVCVTRGRYRSQIAGDSDGALLLFHPAAVEHRDCFHEHQQLAEAHFFALTLEGDASLWCEALRLPLWSTNYSPHTARRCAAVVQACLGDSADIAITNTQLDLEQLVAELLSLLTPDSMPYERAVPAWFGRVCEALIDSEEEDISLSSLAALGSLHPVYFARVFRSIAGCSLGEYRRRYQLNRALSLLRRAQLSLSDVAHDSGFYDHAHFTRHFRARFGVTPSMFRAQVANVQDKSTATSQN